MTNIKNSEIEFIDITKDHKQEVCEIYQEFIDITHASQPNNLRKSFDTFIIENNGYLSLVYYQKQLAGFVEYTELSKKLRDSKGKIEITSLFVRPKYQNLGIGKALIKYVSEFAAKNNKDRVVLYSGLELTEAHKFYEKVGFSKDAFYFRAKSSL